MKIHNEPCKRCGGSSLLMLNDSGLHRVWCCSDINRCAVYQKLRDDGWDISAAYFKESKKDTQAPVNKKILGKFASMDSLESSLRQLAKKMDVPEDELAKQIESTDMVTAYRRLWATFSGRKQKQAKG